MTYLVTVTDTFGGELNYSWVEYYLVRTDNIKTAVVKVSKYTGRKTRKKWGDSESGIYKVIGACVAYDVQWIDEEQEKDFIGNLHHVTFI